MPTRNTGPVAYRNPATRQTSAPGMTSTRSRSTSARARAPLAREVAPPAQPLTEIWVLLALILIPLLFLGYVRHVNHRPIDDM